MNATRNKQPHLAAGTRLARRIRRREVNRPNSLWPLRHARRKTHEPVIAALVLPTVAVALTGELAARERLRQAGGPQDTALYDCGTCGVSFDAAVVCDVPCPHCGTTQEW